MQAERSGSFKKVTWLESESEPLVVKRKATKDAFACDGISEAQSVDVIVK